MDNNGNAYITGYTLSSNFPIVSAIYGTYKAEDAFVTKINTSGNSLVYSTYLGGDHPDYGWGIAADNSGNAYVTGFTNSLDFPTTASAFDTTFNGWREAFVTKIDASGSSYVYSGFLGGTWHDEAYDIAVDTGGNAYVTGYTASSNFPTVSPIYSAPRGNYDAFVTKIDASGSGIVYSTYLGGINHEQGYGIAVDTIGNSYVTGRTLSANFPTASAIYGSLSGSWDAFVTKVDASGSSLVYSTYLGGSADDCGNSIAAGPSGSAYITGYTFSSNFPMASAIYGTNKGNSDVFVTKIDATGNSLVYSTFLGGNAADHGRGIAADATGNAYVAGVTASTNFPTSSAIYGSYKGKSDVFVAKITTDTTPPTVSSTSPANGDADVAINSAITVTFSEAIDATTINTSTFTISGGVSGTVTYDGANHTATFTPSSNLSNSIAYTATIAVGIKDLAGNAMVSDYTWSFTVTGAVDTTPPTVSSTSPADGNTGVAIDTPITVTFGEAMTASTINTSTFTLSGGVTGAVTYSNNIATFTPSSNLSNGITYTATITNGVRDLRGNAMTANYTWSFTTGSNVAESIVVSPTELQLTKMTSRTVVVTVSGANGFPIKGTTVNATVDATGQNLVTVSPTSNVTDANGQATFTISAKNTTVETKVNFQASGLNKTAVVAVKVL